MPLGSQAAAADQFQEETFMIVMSKVEIVPGFPRHDLSASDCTECDICSALNALQRDILALYVAAEKVHWHLRSHSAPSAIPGASFVPDTVARELCANTLQAISLVSRLREAFDPSSHAECAALLTVVAERFSEISRINN
jgi:hypothetical protein